MHSFWKDNDTVNLVGQAWPIFPFSSKICGLWAVIVEQKRSLHEKMARQHPQAYYNQFRGSLPPRDDDNGALAVGFECVSGLELRKTWRCTRYRGSFTGWRAFVRLI